MSDRGPWFQTSTGLHYHPGDPREDEIAIEDIARHLSLQCRYNGACSTFYSVAEHSVRVSRLLPPRLQLWGLLHDAAEAYLGDCVRPVKELLPGYRDMEALAMMAVVGKFGLEWPEPREVKIADLVLLATEKRDLMPADDGWALGCEPLRAAIRPWSPAAAEAAFLDAFYRLHGAGPC